VSRLLYDPYTHLRVFLICSAESCNIDLLSLHGIVLYLPPAAVLITIAQQNTLGAPLPNGWLSSTTSSLKMRCPTPCHFAYLDFAIVRAEAG
jgi:hypothetical protein